MYYNIKIKTIDSEFILESSNKAITQREMDAYFACFFGASEEFKSKIKKVELKNDNLVSIDEFELKNKEEQNFSSNEEEKTEPQACDEVLEETPLQQEEFQENVEIEKEEAVEFSQNVFQEQDVFQEQSIPQENNNFQEQDNFQENNLEELDADINEEISEQNADIQEISETETPLEEIQIDVFENSNIDPNTCEILHNTVGDIEYYKSSEEISQSDINKNEVIQFENVKEEQEANNQQSIEIKHFVNEPIEKPQETAEIELGPNEIGEEIPKIVAKQEQNLAQEENASEIASNNDDCNIEQIESIQEQENNLSQNELSQNEVQENEVQESVVQENEPVIEKNTNVEQKETNIEKSETKNIKISNEPVKKTVKPVSVFAAVQQKQAQGGLFSKFFNKKESQKFPKPNFSAKKENKPVVKKNIVFDFKFFLAGFIISDITHQFLACAFYIKNVLKLDGFTMKSINANLFKATGSIADMSVVSGLIEGGFIDVIENDDTKRYTITAEGEEYFINRYQ